MLVSVLIASIPTTIASTLSKTTLNTTLPLDAPETLIDYLSIYQTTFKSSPILGSLFLCLALIFLFVALASTAELFFCPNLSSIATLLGMPESVSGVTLAALGNGAGDLFATFAAFRTDKIPLALGELYGAATFISFLIAGLVCIIRPSKLPRRPFVRDVIAFIGAAILVNVFVVSGEIDLIKGCALVGYYLLYVLVVIVGVWISQRKMHEMSSHASSVRALIQESTPQLGDLDDNTSTTENRSLLIAEFPDTRLSNMSLVEEADFDADFFLPHLRIQKLASTYFLSNRSRSPTHEHNFSDSNHISSSDTLSNAYRPPRRQASEDEVLSYAPVVTPPDRYDCITTFLKSTLMLAVPVVTKWHRMTVLHRLHSIVASPLVLILTLTAPVVHEQYLDGYMCISDSLLEQRESLLMDTEADMEDGHIHVLDQEEKMIPGLVMTQMFFLPMVLCLYFEVYLVNVVIVEDSVYIPVWGVSIIFGIVLSALTWWMVIPRISSRWILVFLAVMGFGVSMLFVATVSNELIGLLEAIGVLSGLSPTILGLTLFALGNSIGELVTNIQIARMGYPTMAIGACYGGPMLNIVLGVGVSSLYMVIKTGHAVRIPTMDMTFWITSWGLYVGLVVGLVMAIYNRFQVNERFGMTLLGMYGLLMDTSIDIDASGSNVAGNRATTTAASENTLTATVTGTIAGNTGGNTIGNTGNTTGNAIGNTATQDITAATLLPTISLQLSEPNPLPAFPILDHREFLTTRDRGELRFIIMRTVVMLLETTIAITALVLSRNSTYPRFYLICVAGHAIMLPLVLILAPRYFQTSRELSRQQHRINEEYRRRRYINAIDLPFLILLVAGLIALMSPSRCLETAPLIYYANSILVVLSFMYFCSPFLLCIVAIFFLPCIFLLSRYYETHPPDILDGSRGAPEELINGIPILKFRRKIAPDNTALTFAALDKSASIHSPILMEQFHHSDDNATSVLDIQPINTQTDEAAFIESPKNIVKSIQDLTHTVQPIQAESPQNSKSKKRYFRLLSKPLRFGKASSSTDITAPPAPTFLELDEEDAHCIICLAEYDSGDDLKQMPCKHHFHAICVDDWLRLKSNCPLCIQELQSDPKQKSTRTR